MTILTTRNEIFKKNKIIASELIKMQKAFYDEEVLQYYKDDNQEQVYLEQFDCLENEEMDYPIFNKIIGINHSDIETFTIALAEKLIELFQVISATNFIIVSHLKLDFFGNLRNRFIPLKNAYKKLKKIIGNTTYKEAIKIDIASLPDFVDILFWLTRCDSSISEYIFLFDEKEQIQINLCKYGNLHITEYHKEKFTENKLKLLGWEIIEGQEYDNFTSDGQIAGRQIKI